MSTQVILLERVESLGKMGDVVSVRPGYARNFLLPQKKALRATKDNVAYFEAQKKNLEAESERLKKEAEKTAKKIEGKKIPLIRQASEGGQMFGSVTARDIAAEASKAAGTTIAKTAVRLNQSFKLIGLFPVTLALHPEVSVEIIINIARSEEEAKTQAETGRALIVEDARTANAAVKAAPQEQQPEAAAAADAAEAVSADASEQAPKAEKKKKSKSKDEASE